jgi:hypothetical protein
VRLPFKIDGEIKTFQDMHKLKQFMNTKPALQKEFYIQMRKTQSQTELRKE